MAFDILKYESGQSRQTGAAKAGKHMRQAQLIQGLADLYSDTEFRQNKAAIRESQKAARADVIQGTIDPDRQINDEAYAATTLRNTLQRTGQQLAANLDDPAHEHAKMNPRDYKEFLQKEAAEFYRQNAKSPHASIQAEVFSRYTLANQDHLVAKQAKVYKDNMKIKQAQAGIEALTSLPAQSTGDDFDMNTSIVLNEMFPQNRFTSIERQQYVLQSAIAAAHLGDRRLLDYGIRYMDLDVHSASGVQQAENAYTKYTREQQAIGWANGRVEREKLSSNGLYTQDMWERDMRDPATVKQYSPSTINRWYKDSITQHRGLLNQQDYEKSFMAGMPMGEGKSADLQRTAQSAWQFFMEQTDQPTAQRWASYWDRQSKQGSFANKALKAQFDGYFARPIYNIEAFDNPGLREAFLAASTADDILSPEQKEMQFGKDGYENFVMMRGFLDSNLGDWDKAKAEYIEYMNRKAKGQEVVGLNPQGQKDIETAIDDIIAGKNENSDPTARGFFGIFAKGGEKIATQGIRGQMVKEVQRLMTEKGIAQDKAIKLAEDRVAAQHKFFGNEWINTGGASLNQFLNMPETATEDDNNHAWGLFCERNQLDPDKAHLRFVGRYVQLMDEEGADIGPLIPATAIGEDFRLWQAKEMENQQARNDMDKLNDIAEHNRHFENMMMLRAGGNGKFEVTPGVTLDQYMVLPEEDRLAVRNEHMDARYQWLKKLTKPLVDFVHDVKAGKYVGEANERFRTIAKPGAFEIPEHESAPVADIKTAQAATPTAPTTTDLAGMKAKAKGGAAKATTKHRISMKGIKLNKLESDLVSDEGAIGVPYKDSVDVLTIGIGHNLEANPFDSEELKKFGKDRDWWDKPMTASEAIWLKRRDIKDATAQAKRVFGDGWKKLKKNQKDVVINMAFQLGETGLANFKSFKKALIKGDVDEAIKSMKGSKWYKQTPNRVKKHIKRLKG